MNGPPDAGRCGEAIPVAGVSLQEIIRRLWPYVGTQFALHDVTTGHSKENVMYKPSAQRTLKPSHLWRLTCASILFTGLVISLAGCTTPPSNRDQSPNATKRTSSLEAPVLPGAAYTNLDVLRVGDESLLQQSMIGASALGAPAQAASEPLAQPVVDAASGGPVGAEAPPLGPVQGT